MIGTYAVERVLRRLLRPGPEGAHPDRAGFHRAFAEVDVLISPTSPTTAFALGEKLDDPVAMYLNDIATIPVNLAGICGMSFADWIGTGTVSPVGLQIMAPAMADDRLYNVGAALEAALDASRGHTLLEEAPAL